jgi:hypothetical protein
MSVSDLPKSWRDAAALGLLNDPKSPSIYIDCAEELEMQVDELVDALQEARSLLKNGEARDAEHILDIVLRKLKP